MDRLIDHRANSVPTSSVRHKLVRRSVALLLAANAIGVVRMCNAELRAEPKEVAHHLPRLSSVFPQGARPGTRTRVEILGECLDRAQIVVANDPAIHGRVPGGSYTKLDVELEVEAMDTPAATT